MERERAGVVVAGFEANASLLRGAKPMCYVELLKGDSSLAEVLHLGLTRLSGALLAGVLDDYAVLRLDLSGMVYAGLAEVQLDLGFGDPAGVAKMIRSFWRNAEQAKGYKDDYKAGVSGVTEEEIAIAERFNGGLGMRGGRITVREREKKMFSYGFDWRVFSATIVKQMEDGERRTDCWATRVKLRGAGGPDERLAFGLMTPQVIINEEKRRTVCLPTEVVIKFADYGLGVGVEGLMRKVEGRVIIPERLNQVFSDALLVVFCALVPTEWRGGFFDR